MWRSNSKKHFKGKLLTLWRPWPVAIACFGKDIENRTWTTAYRGPLAIHTGKCWGRQAASFLAKILGPQSLIELLNHPLNALDGHIVCITNITDCLNHYQTNSIWATGPKCWRLGPITMIKPISQRGYPGLWDVEFDYKAIDPLPNGRSWNDQQQHLHEIGLI